MDGWMDGQKKKQIKKKWMIEWKYICLKRTDIWMLTWIGQQQKDGWIDRQMDDWMERKKQMDG